MSILDTNLQAMKLGFPELYVRVINAFEKKIEPDFLEIIKHETTTETGTIYVTTKEKKRIRLNSAYDPRYEAEIWFQGQENTEASILFIMGIGNGSFAKTVVEERAGRSQILVYEPSAQLFLYALQNFDLTFLFCTPGVRVICEKLNADMYLGVMELMLTMDNCEDAAFFTVPQFKTLFPNSLKKFLGGYMDGVGRLMANFNTLRKFIHLLPYNQLHNLRYLEKNTVVPRLAKVWDPETPILLIGAGPSLQEEVEVLREAGEKSFLFAVDSALPFLMSVDIIPDAFISIEPDQDMEYFEDERIKDIPMFCRLTTTYSVLDRQKAPIIFGYDESFGQKIYENYGVPISHYRYGGNGATSLFAISKELGAKNIIMVGQDMSYGRDGKSHVGDRDDGYTAEKRFIYESNTGEKVQSRQDWHRFALWYENAIPVCKFEHVVNTAAHGLKVNGTEYMPLNEALVKYGRKHEKFSNILSQTKETFEKNSGFSLQNFYKRCWNEHMELHEMLAADPEDENRKKYLLYELLSMYEMAAYKEDWHQGQKEGMDKLEQYLKQCMMCEKENE